MASQRLVFAANEPEAGWGRDLFDLRDAFREQGPRRHQLVVGNDALRASPPSSSPKKTQAMPRARAVLAPRVAGL